MTTINLTDLTRIADAATQGEWEIGKMANQVMVAPSTSSDIPLAFTDYPHNATYIATFDPPTVKALLARVVAAEAERDEAQAAGGDAGTKEK